jgi:integrase
MTIERERLHGMIMRHPLFGDFADWLRLHSDSPIRDETVYSYIRGLDLMQRNNGLDLDNPNLEHVLKNINGVSAMTQTFRRFLIKRWFEYRGIPLDEETRCLLKARRGPLMKKIHPKDLLTVENIEDIIINTQSPALRAFYYCLFDTAARPGGLCSINVKDVHQDQFGYVFYFRKTKTDHSRRPVGLLMPRASQLFEQWWAVHPSRGNPDTEDF